jgi:hypothetical protein
VDPRNGYCCLGCYWIRVFPYFRGCIMSACPTLKRGILAYLDSFAGLIPCKVIDVWRLRGIAEARVKLTASRGPYKRGEILIDTVLHVIPRPCVSRRKYSSAILPYHVQTDVEALSDAIVRKHSTRGGAK